MKKISSIKKSARYLWLVLISFPLQSKAVVDPLNSLRDIGKDIYGNGGQTDIKIIIGNLVKIILGFVGMLFLLLIIWGGIQWMTSGGNEQKIEDAKKRIVNATIGLVLIVTAYSIAYSITRWLSEATSEVKKN